jgi:hypothetical protein
MALVASGDERARTQRPSQAQALSERRHHGGRRMARDRFGVCGRGEATRPRLGTVDRATASRDSTRDWS